MKFIHSIDARIGDAPVYQLGALVVMVALLLLIIYWLYSEPGKMDRFIEKGFDRIGTVFGK